MRQVAIRSNCLISVPLGYDVFVANNQLRKEDIVATPVITFSLAGESSSVRDLQYANELLFVTFTSGVTYCYSGVSLATVKAVIGADSVGSALHSNIISQSYEYTRLSK